MVSPQPLSVKNKVAIRALKKKRNYGILTARAKQYWLQVDYFTFYNFT